MVTLTIQPLNMDKLEITVPKSYHVGHILRSLPYANEAWSEDSQTEVEGGDDAEQVEEGAPAVPPSRAPSGSSARLTFGGLELDQDPQIKSRKSLGEFDVEDGAILFLSGACLSSTTEHVITIPAPAIQARDFEEPRMDEIRFYDGDPDVLEHDHLGNCYSYTWACSPENVGGCPRVPGPIGVATALCGCACGSGLPRRVTPSELAEDAV